MKYNQWTRGEVAKLKRLFPKFPTAMVAAELDRPVEAVKKKAFRLGLKKSRTYLRSLGR